MRRPSLLDATRVERDLGCRTIGPVAVILGFGAADPPVANVRPKKLRATTALVGRLGWLRPTRASDLERDRGALWGRWGIVGPLRLQVSDALNPCSDGIFVLLDPYPWYLFVR
jgi:hypothetical protein